MIKKSLIELTKCRLREFIREPSASFFVFSMPIIWMIILGQAFSSNEKELIHVGVLSNKYSQEVEYLLAKKEHIKAFYGTKEELYKKLRQNQVSLLLNFETRDLINYTYDANNPRATLHRHKIDTVIQENFGRQDSLAVKDSIYTPPGSRYIDFLIPGLLALSLLTTSLFGTGMIIVVSRREKLLQRFLVTPMKPLEYFSSHLISRLLIALMEVLVILGAGYILFGFTLKGSFLSYLSISFLGALCFTSLAILCSSRGKNSSAYSGFANLLMIIFMMLSGIWFNRNNFPLWLQNISQYSPLSALVDALRKIALEGESLLFLGKESLLILCYTFIFLALSKKYFRWL